MVALTSACAERATPTTHHAKIRELAERCLRSNSYLALKNISYELLDGVLVLRGCWLTYYLKQVGQEVVTHLEGNCALTIRFGS